VTRFHERELHPNPRNVLRTHHCIELAALMPPAAQNVMTANRGITAISGYSELAGTLEIVDPAPLYAVNFCTLRSNTPQPQPLPPAAGDCAAGRGLTKSEDEETITIKRPDRSTYPEEKS
jgi:hypothetical protein